MSRIMEQHVLSTPTVAEKLPVAQDTATPLAEHATIPTLLPTSSAFPRLYAPLKRCVDIVFAGLGLLVLFPIFVVVAILIALDSRGPIFHRRRVLAQQSYQEGDNPHTFDAFKFRTMIPDADEWLKRNPEVWAEYQKEFKLKDDPRITKVGLWLRKTSMDELPQLINILRGQMSLVGPRMITPAELIHYEANSAKLLTVPPGLTGFWQVSGRSNVSYRERVGLDMWYIDNRSLRLDLDILLRTFTAVLQRRGAH